MSELKPCPWCNKPPSIVCPDNSYGIAYITCGDANECPADVSVAVDLTAGEAIEDAKRIWNDRPDLTAERDALREADPTRLREEIAVLRARIDAALSSTPTGSDDFSGVNQTGPGWNDPADGKEEG